MAPFTQEAKTDLRLYPLMLPTRCVNTTIHNSGFHYLCPAIPVGTGTIG